MRKKKLITHGVCKVSYFLTLLIFVQLFQLSLGSLTVFAGPKKAKPSSADRFIPERLSQSSDEAHLRDLRMSRIFSDIPEDLESFLGQDSMMRHLFGMSLGEVVRGRVLHQHFAPTSDATSISRLADLLGNRHYRVNPRHAHVIEAPQLIDDYYSRSMAAMQDKLMVALQDFDEEMNEGVDSFYLSLINEVGRSPSMYLGGTPRRVSFLKWLTPTLYFVGARTGAWGIDDFVNLETMREVATFNTPDAQQLGVAHSVVGAHYFESTQNVVVAYSDGSLVEFKVSDTQQNRFISHYPHAMTSIEFSSHHSHVAIGTREEGVFIHEWPSLKLVSHIPVMNRAATRPLSWHPKHAVLAVGTGRSDHRLMIYSLAEKRIVFEKDVVHQVSDLAWSEAGTELVVSLGSCASEEVDQEPRNHLLVWAAVLDGSRIEMKSLGGFPMMEERISSISLASADVKGEVDRQRIKIFALVPDLQQIIAVDYSRMKPIQPKDRPKEPSGFGSSHPKDRSNGLSGFGSSHWLR